MDKQGKIKTMNRIFLLTILLVLSIFVIKNVLAYPPLPTEFYGTIKTFNVPATTGTITAYAGNTTCGTFGIVNDGFYGVLSCIGKDNETGNGSGGIAGQEITFRFDGSETTVFGDNIFESGQFKVVNITHPLLVCGDGFCDSIESCVSCETDCNACNFTGNSTGNTSGNGSSNITTPDGPPTGGGAPSGGGGGGGGGGGSGGGGGGGGGGSSGAELPYFCAEQWRCGNWSDCFIIGLRNRTCRDIANCGSYDSRPPEVEECEYLGTCFDELINCHSDKCEEGIDCGGPCDKQCPFIEQPSFNVTVKIPKFEIPTQVCEKKVDATEPSIWIFLIIVIASLVSRYVYDKHYVKKLREDEKLTPLDRSRKIRSTKRKSLLFTITLTFLTAVAFLYAYYFLLCPSDFFKYSWMLAAALILIPLVIHVVMKKYEYSESKHLYKSKLMEDSHYAHLVKLIELENNILAEEENAISSRLYELSKREEFREFLETDSNIKEIYKNLVRLYADYKEKKNPFNVEKIVCDEINALDSDPAFQSQIEKHSEMKHIFDRLKKLYNQYEEKQKLYDKIEELEQARKKEQEEKENKEKKE